MRYRWRIVKRPRGSKARLRGARSARPWLVPDKRGSYRIALTTRVALERTPPLGRGAASAAPPAPLGPSGAPGGPPGPSPPLEPITPAPNDQPLTPLVASQPDVVTISAQPAYPLMRLKASVPMGSNCYGITVGPDQAGVQPTSYKNPSCGQTPGIQVLTLNQRRSR